MKNIFGGSLQGIATVVVLSIFSFSLVCIPRVEAIGRPFIYSQKFAVSGGDLVLKIYGNNFSSSFYEPQVMFNDVFLPVLFANDSVIRAEAPLPLAVGDHEVHVLIGSSASNTRDVEFRASDQQIIDVNRDMLGMTPVNWNLVTDVVAVEEAIVDPVSEQQLELEIADEIAQSIAIVEDIPTVPTPVAFVAVTEEELSVRDMHSVFSDLHTVPWVVDYLPEMYDQGIIGGYSDATFRPWATVSRVEALKMMMEALDVYSDFAFDEQSFDDVLQDTWQHSYVELAHSFGMLSTGTSSFYPDKPITRFEVLEALLSLDKLYHGRTYKREDSFEYFDLDFSGNKTISPFVLMRIINRGESFRPNDYLTRAEWTKILSLYLQRRSFGDFVEHVISF